MEEALFMDGIADAHIDICDLDKNFAVDKHPVVGSQIQVNCKGESKPCTIDNISIDAASQKILINYIPIENISENEHVILYLSRKESNLKKEFSLEFEKHWKSKEKENFSDEKYSPKKGLVYLHTESGDYFQCTGWSLNAKNFHLLVHYVPYDIEKKTAKKLKHISGFTRNIGDWGDSIIYNHRVEKRFQHISV